MVQVQPGEQDSHFLRLSGGGTLSSRLEESFLLLEEASKQHQQHQQHPGGGGAEGGGGGGAGGWGWRVGVGEPASSMFATIDLGGAWGVRK